MDQLEFAPAIYLAQVQGELFCSLGLILGQGDKYPLNLRRPPAFLCVPPPIGCSMAHIGPTAAVQGGFE